MPGGAPDVQQAGRRFQSRAFLELVCPESQGIANAIEALSRGEADAEWALIGLNERIRRYDPTLEADCPHARWPLQMIVSGGAGDR